MVVWFVVFGGVCCDDVFLKWYDMCFVIYMFDIECVCWLFGGVFDVFDVVMLMVVDGEFVGLVGLNGSGKMSLLCCVFCYVWFDVGCVVFDM